MKRLPPLLLLLSLVASPALADEQTFYYWANTNGGDWTATANWVMEDGSAATTYPRVAGDLVRVAPPGRVPRLRGFRLTCAHILCMICAQRQPQRTFP